MGAAPLTRRFVLLLAAKRRLYLLLDAIHDFEALRSRQRGEIDADVASARPLSDRETAELKRVLKAKFGRDRRLWRASIPRCSAASSCKWVRA